MHYAILPIIISAAVLVPLSDGLNRKQQAKVTNLPGLTFNPGFNSYSGFLKVSPTRFFHYWLVESQRSPSSDPLVLWLNGGPGCSSLGGFFKELGPFRVNKDGKTLFENVHSWNKVANVLFLESPAGVGFSYSTDGNNATGDNQTAWENYAALTDFFVNVFPEYQTRDFFITGESYAGVYIPTLTAILVDKINAGIFPAKLKGIAIGNGILSYQKQANSIVDFLYFHGVIGDDTWSNLKKECCGNTTCTAECDYYTALETNPENSTCHKLASHVTHHLVRDTRNDAYNLYQDCYDPRKWTALLNSRFASVANGVSLMHYESTDPYSGFPCWSESGTHNYLNIPSVQSALHIPASFTKSKNWTVCGHLDYKRDYDSQESFFDHILDHSNVSILIYNGDVDMVCNFLGDEWFGNNVSQTHNLTVTQPRQPWYYAGQIAGYVKRYQRMDIMTVKGSGHFVPMDRPGPALQFFNNFINGASNYSQPDNINVTPKPLIPNSSSTPNSMKFIVSVTAAMLVYFK